MSDAWQTILTNLAATAGGGFALLGAAAWLIKSLVTNKLTRDVEAFKTNLRADADTEIEKLRHSLQMTAFEHQVRFSKLHEKRAEVVAELYNHLVTLQNINRRFVFHGPKSLDTSEYREVEDQFWKLDEYVERHEIYLPEPVSTSIQEFIRIIRRHQVMVAVHADGASGTSEQRLERQKVTVDAVAAFEKDIPQLKNALTTAFRELLGEAPKVVEEKQV